MLKTIDDVVDNDLCISCGACCLSPKGNIGKMIESKEKGIFLPEFFSEENDAMAICPGKGYPIVEIQKNLFPNVEHEDLELGRWKKMVATYSTSEEILKNASSGGVMTTIAHHLLKKKVVEGVLVTKFTYGENGPRPTSHIATTLEELIEAQGSKYAPVPIFNALEDIKNFHGNILFIGTPCQIAALRLLQEKDEVLKNKIPLTIGNFCGGYRDLRETDTLIKRANVDKQNVSFFRYRGGGQPGSMLIKDKEKRLKELAYPGYARMTGYIKHLRCRLCVDATAELADFACGDAWLPKYTNSDKPWSIIIARSEKAMNILNDMGNEDLLIQEKISVEDVKKSQAGNLTSKKHRQFTRMKLYKMLGYVLPVFDGGYIQDKNSFLLELKVHLSHSFFALLEKVALYKKFAILINRYPKEK